jgi:hypothetical protein
MEVRIPDTVGPLDQKTMAARGRLPRFAIACAAIALMLAACGSSPSAVPRAVGKTFWCTGLPSWFTMNAANVLGSLAFALVSIVHRGRHRHHDPTDGHLRGAYRVLKLSPG